MTPRRRLTPAERAILWERQDGKCGCKCGEPLTGDSRIDQDEHAVPRALGGSDDLDNRRLMLAGHHLEKTKRDIKAIAKVKRIIAKAAGTWRTNRKKIKGRTKIASRGFDKRHQPLRCPHVDNTKQIS